ncbi:MAG: glycosyltransferase [Pseudomonadales bacterium]|nr:glycosyltransferase [Pseudomonadales bacterium]
MDISVAIVNYNTDDLVERCVESIVDRCGEVREIIIVDNSPRQTHLEALADRHKVVRLIDNRFNRFFSGGFNQALAEAQGKYTLILNSDTWFEEDGISPLWEFMEANDDYGAVEGTIIAEPSGEVTRTGSRELTLIREIVRAKLWLQRIFTGIWREYSYADWDRQSDREVEVICDAYVLVRTGLVLSLGGYNEALKLYYTEEYLSDRIRQAGKKLYHKADARIHHEWSSSTNKAGKGWIEAIYKTDRRLYFAQKSKPPGS